MVRKLSCSQQGVYLGCMAHPESTQYNLPFLGRFREAMDPEKLRSAPLKAISAHPVLCAVVKEDAKRKIHS